MILLDLLHMALNLDVQTPPGSMCDGKACPGSAVTAIAAAYGTQGMWVLSDLVDQLLWTPLGALGPLLYVCAAIGGLTSLAIGAPPRTYMWFFLGPAIYRWLLGTPHQALGMSWQMGGRAMDQREVWRLSEVGLVNSNIGVKGIRDARGVLRPVQFYNNQAPSQSISVPYFFAYYDSVVSGTIQGLINLTGMYRQRESTAPDDGSNNTSLPREAPVGGCGAYDPDSQWFLISSRKWGTVQNITDARVQSPHLRTALTRFFAGECGNQFASVINPGRFLSAMYGKGAATPVSIFDPGDINDDLLYVDTTSYEDGDYYGTAKADPLDNVNYPHVRTALGSQIVPFPREIKKMFEDNGDYSYRHGLNINDDVYKQISAANTISCRNYLKFIVAGFRWETGRIFGQMLSGLPPGAVPADLVYGILYGWNIRNPEGKQLTLDQQADFIRDLIFVHLVRNEMAVAKPALTQSQLNTGQLSSRITSDSAEGHLRFVASKNKSSEFYQWALMIPHMQGILLYYLAIGYPFACLLLILPGMHKTLFTWMSFWAWAKLWDLGFAMVMALERSVWAMLGSNANINKSLGQIAHMQKWGVLNDGGSYCSTNGVTKWIYTQQVANGGSMANFNVTTAEHWAPLMRLFDRALTVGANLDLDLQNSYYVYIMAGLYFAVPVVSGQLVLGAKSGMSSLVGNVIGAVGQEAGRQASQGFSGDLQTRIKTNFSAASQAAYGASMRQSPLLAQAMEAGNSARLAGMQGDYLQQQSGLTDAKGTLASLSSNSADKALNQGYPGVTRQLGAGLKGYRGGKAWAKNKSLFDEGPPAGGAGGAPTPSAFDQLTGAGDSAMTGMMSLEANRIGQAGIANNAAGTIKKAGYGIDGFANKSAGTQWEVGSQNYGKQAEYEGQMAAWEMRNAFSASMSATAASLGGLPGGLEAGSMPQDSTGMAMSGEMSSAANSAVRWADPYSGNSGFDKERGSRLGALRGEQTTLPSYFSGSTPGILLNHGFRNDLSNGWEAVAGMDGTTGAFPAPVDQTPLQRPGQAEVK